jgi:GntR family transcriptional regulator
MRTEKRESLEREGNALPRLDLARSSEGTLHRQIYRTLAERIKRGDVRPGERLPTETQLMETYSVSRSTARRALDELRREDLVERQPGKGTFVAMPRLEATIPHLHSITEEIEQLGYTAGSRLISVHAGRADETLAAQLHLAPGNPVLLLERLRTADGRPFYFAESALNVTAFPSLLKADYHAPTLSLYRVFEQATGRRVQRLTQWLSAVGASRNVARHLEVRAGSPLLQLERVLFVDDNQPVEMVRAWFIGGSYKYYSELGTPVRPSAGKDD